MSAGKRKRWASTYSQKSFRRGTPQKRSTTPQDEEYCAITLVPLSEIRAVYRLHCHHAFERAALAKYLRNKRTCPVCRQPVKPSVLHVLQVPFTIEESSGSERDDTDSLADFIVEDSCLYSEDEEYTE